MGTYDDARTRGLAAFAAWDDEANPKLCPCCGAWTRRDGSPGPLLPTCADWRKDFSNPWPHDLSCVRVRDADWADDVCESCADTTPPTATSDPAGTSAEEKADG